MDWVPIIGIITSMGILPAGIFFFIYKSKKAKLHLEELKIKKEILELELMKDERKIMRLEAENKLLDKKISE